MNIVVERFEYSDKSTIGRLLIDDVLYCYTLEDVDRRLEDTPDAKIAGETAIPRGVYKVIIDFSDRKSTRLNSSHSQQSRMPSSA